MSLKSQWIEDFFFFSNYLIKLIARWPAYQGAQDKACAIQLETFVSAMELIIFKIVAAEKINSRACSASILSSCRGASFSRACSQIAISLTTRYCSTACKKISAVVLPENRCLSLLPHPQSSSLFPGLSCQGSARQSLFLPAVGADLAALVAAVSVSAFLILSVSYSSSVSVLLSVSVFLDYLPSNSISISKPSRALLTRNRLYQPQVLSSDLSLLKSQLDTFDTQAQILKDYLHDFYSAASY